MIVQLKMMNIHLVSYYIGILLIFITHFVMLVLPKAMSQTQLRVHAIINIVAAIMIAYYFMNKENYIKF